MNKIIVVSLFALLIIASGFIAFERQGLWPWVGIALGFGGLGLMAILDLRKIIYYLALTYSLVIVGWVGSVYYVFSTWESGEVVEIQIADDVSFRTWVVESKGKEALIYDCPPENLNYLKSGTVVSVTRGNEQFRASIEASPVDLDSPDLIDVYNQYETKYAAESFATDVYYLFIGPKRGSRLHVLYLTRLEQ